MPLCALILAHPATAQTRTQTTEPPPSEAPSSIPRDNWDVRFENQDLNGSLYTWTGHPAEFEDSRMLFRAEFISYDRDTGDIVARGNVYFHSFERGEQLWCDHLEYNTESATGKFYEVRGETIPKILSRPGILTTNSPFHFEGRWAERLGEKYVLHDGWITNCKLPKPWWRIMGPRFDIVPDKRALAYRSQFRVRRFPLFYAPVYYHSLEKEPRKSGFLTPSPGHSSIGGFMLGVGYFWAINRSNDVTYRLTDYFSRGYAHHVDLRGKPRPGTDYDVILYGVQDRGAPNSGDPPQTYSGLSVYAVATSELGKGWTARAFINYISSFRFRQAWTQSFNEAIGSEIHSVGFLNKSWSTFTVDGVFARLQNYQRQEQQVLDPNTGDKFYEADSVTIRKLPEVELSSRDIQLPAHIPLWFSFDSSAGLLKRSEPFFSRDPVTGDNLVASRYETGPRMSRINAAPHITSALHLWYFNLVPSLGFQETFYSEAQTPTTSQTAINAGQQYQVLGTDIVRSTRDFSLDLLFPPLVRVFEKKTVFGDKLKHVIEPRATYRYVTGVGTDFNRYILFDPTDLVANTSQLEISLTNRIYAKRGNSVQEIFSWELMQARFFDPTFGGALQPGQRNVFGATAILSGFAFVGEPRTDSPIISRMRVITPINGLRFTWQADYDPARSGISNSTFLLDYTWKKFVTSIGNNSIHANPALTPNANQYVFRLSYGDANRRGWSAGAVSVYDYRQGQILYTTTQVTYNTDCCGVSVQYHRYLRYGIGNDNQFRVSFVVANIGSFGTMRKQDRLF